MPELGGGGGGGHKMSKPYRVNKRKKVETNYFLAYLGDQPVKEL